MRINAMDNALFFFNWQGLMFNLLKVEVVKCAGWRSTVG